MINSFKFLQDNDEGDMELYNGASWMFGLVENLDQYRYHIIVDDHYGIHSFLNHFPPAYVVTILSITGPNGRVHNANTEYDDGWGFDITGDLLRIEWVNFLP